MRKGISFLLIMALVLTSFTAAFAAEAGAPADVKDTRYEAAVSALMEKGIVSGYPDGSFRPEWTISRAEASIIAVKAMAPSEEALKEAAKSSFPDLTGYDWAAKYINYAAAKNVISGYPNGTFDPAGQVTYAELASMLVRALGYKVEDLTGTWPDNFITKAATLGIFTDIDHQVNNVNTSALRGHVALMTFRVAGDITKANKPDGATDPGEDDADDPTENPAGSLADFSGRAFGIVLDTATVLNDKGDVVDEYEFLFGDKILYLKTNGKDPLDPTTIATTIAGNHVAGNLYGLQMSNGIVTRFGTSDDTFAGLSSAPANFEDFTYNDDSGRGVWAEVKDVSNYVIETKLSHDGRNVFSVLEDASIYVAVVEGGVITGYEPGTIRDIKTDKWVRLYSVTGNDPGVVEVVVVSGRIPKR
ncbi:MAG: S-layer homology domain-containing protein [Anaerovoracaceae bacterium]